MTTKPLVDRQAAATTIHALVMVDMDTKQKLLDAATELAQTRGYNGFSFHDLADRVSVRTASIHYHYPTKADLGRALVTRYTDAFMRGLGPPAGPVEQRLRHYIGCFRAAVSQGRMCLCGMIGAEVEAVPPELAREVGRFFAANEEWLIEVFAGSGLAKAAARSRARLTLAALEGGMILARVSRNAAHFEDVAKAILALGAASRAAPRPD